MKWNEVKVLKIAQNFTLLQVKLLQKQNTSSQLKVLEKLLKLSIVTRYFYFTTLRME